MNNFTLIIPTHNRHHYLKRSMEYFKNLKAEVVYCDSSLEKYEGELHPNVTYLHLPGENFASKVLFALSEIKTNFVALCADDDFIVIDSLYKGLSVLTEYKNYKTIVGQYISFKDHFDGHYYPLYQELPHNIDKNPEKNVELFFSNYYQILWAMYDKEVVLNAFQIINDAKFYNDNYIEMIIGSCACYSGGIKFLNEIWGVRELSTEEHWGDTHAPITSMKIAQIQGDYGKFRNLLDKNTFNGYAEKVMTNYLHSHIKANGFFKFWISKIIPKNIKKILLKYFFRNTKGFRVDLNQYQINTLNPITEILIKSNLNNVK
jgi:glycosyltransferase domain-containing protein